MRKLSIVIPAYNEAAFIGKLLEVIQSISGVTFEDCWPRRVILNDGDIEVPMISLDDLKQNKLASGRTKDLLDVEELS